jgi:putative transposase
MVDEVKAAVVEDAEGYCQVVLAFCVRYARWMHTPCQMPCLKGFRFTREITAYAMWAYHRFALSTADVEDLLAERGVIVSREAIRLWVNRFGRHFADCVRRDRPAPRDKWHVDEVVITVRGIKQWLWRAIDADGNVLDILVQPRRNAKAATRFLRGLMARFGTPRVVVTDKLRSYVDPIRTLAPGAEHRAHKGLNNAVEVSHRPTRKREKIFGRFKSLRQAQRFLSAHDQINLIFRFRRHKLTAASCRHARADAFALWHDYTAEMTA